MPGESSISFKAYIMDGRDYVEVRRFEVDQGVVTNFDYIRERLQYIFPALREKTFKVLWKDSEGDEVTISSDEEMMIALSEIKSDLCKLMIRLSESNPLGEFHIGINPFSECPALQDIQGSTLCDSCQKDMQGFRYKCLECLNFYQCGDCEGKGSHREHVMIRLNQNYPTLISLIPKGMHILKHMVKGSTKCLSKAAQTYGEQFRCGYDFRGPSGVCKRRGKRHSHSEKHCEKKCETERCQSAPEQQQQQQQQQRQQQSAESGYIASEVERLVQSFLRMFPMQAGCPMAAQQSQETKEAQRQMETEESSQDEDMGCEILDAPEPVKLNDEDGAPGIHSENSSKQENNLGASGNSPSPHIAEAVQVLTEMGFKNGGEWLSQILQRFDGDISRALDHLMQNSK